MKGAIKENEARFGSVTGFAAEKKPSFFLRLNSSFRFRLRAVIEEEMMWLNLEVSSLQSLS